MLQFIGAEARRGVDGRRARAVVAVHGLAVVQAQRREAVALAVVVLRGAEKRDMVAVSMPSRVYVRRALGTIRARTRV